MAEGMAGVSAAGSGRTRVWVLTSAARKQEHAAWRGPRFAAAHLTTSAPEGSDPSPPRSSPRCPSGSPTAATPCSPYWRCTGRCLLHGRGPWSGCGCGSQAAPNSLARPPRLPPEQDRQPRSRRVRWRTCQVRQRLVAAARPPAEDGHQRADQLQHGRAMDQGRAAPYPLHVVAKLL